MELRLLWPITMEIMACADSQAHHIYVLGRQPRLGPRIVLSAEKLSRTTKDNEENIYNKVCINVILDFIQRV